MKSANIIVDFARKFREIAVHFPVISNKFHEKVGRVGNTGFQKDKFISNSSNR